MPAKRRPKGKTERRPKKPKGRKTTAQRRKPPERGEKTPGKKTTRRLHAKSPEQEVRELRKRCAELLQRLDLKAEQLALVNGVMRTIITGAALTDLLKVFASNLKTVVPFDRASVSLVDYEREVFHIPFKIQGGRVVETKEAPRPFGTTILSAVVEERRPVLRSDLRKEARFATDADFIQKGFATEIIFPLEVGDKVFGTFQVGCFEADRLTDGHMRLLREIVPAVAVAVYQHFSDQKFVFV